MDPKILQALKEAALDQRTYADSLYRKGPRMAQSYAAAAERVANTDNAIAALEAINA